MRPAHRQYDPSADRRAYDPALFAGTAPYYRRFRTGYPEAVFELLAGEFHLGPHTRVLDLGCGTGQIAIPLTRRGVPVLAMDPDGEMLAEGRLAAREIAAEIEWRQGSSWELGPELGQLRLVTIGRAFHWMDRIATLAAIDQIVESQGGVALIGPLHRDDPLMDGYGRAQAAIMAVVVEFLGPGRRAGGGTYGHPVDRHETALANSAFSRVETHRFPSPRTWTIDQLIGLTLSSSYAAPPLFGERLPAFEQALRKRLTALDPAGIFGEQDSTEVFIGRRPV